MIIKLDAPAREIAGALSAGLLGQPSKLQQVVDILNASLAPKPRPDPAELFTNGNGAAPKTERRCKTCNEPFELRTPNQRYCSVGCQQSGPRAECTAEGCSKPVKAKGLCQTHWQRLHRGNPNVVPVTRTCEHCTKTYTPRTSRDRFCSKDCREKTVRARRLKPLEARNCDRCGTMFMPKTHKQLYCSVECRDLMRAETAPPCRLCEQPALTRGLCSKHYAARRYAGVPTLSIFD